MKRINAPYIVSLFLISCTMPATALSQSLIWETNLGGIYSENGNAGLETAEGDYLVLGCTYSFGEGQYDIYLVKTGSTGDTLWTRTYGGADTEYGFDMTQADSGNYVIVGSTRSFGSGNRDIYLIKIDSLGNIRWARTFGGAENDEARSVRQIADGGFIICGTTYSFGAGYSDIYLLRVDSLGDTVWTRTFGGAGGESGLCVRQTADGGFMAVGSTGSFGTGYSSVYVVRVNSDGDSLWARAYGGAGADMGYTVEWTPDNGYLIGGATASFGQGFTDLYLIKIDSSGDTLWTRTYGGSGEERLYSICAARDGNYVLTGTTDSYGAGKLDIYLTKITPLGDTIWTRTCGGTKSDYGRMTFQEQSGAYILIGETYSYSAGGTDIYLAKIGGESTPVQEEDPYSIPTSYELAQNYPNPFNLTTIIEYTLPRHSPVRITIYNVLGQIVRHWDYTSRRPGVNSVHWDGRDNRGTTVASGVYFYRLEANEFAETRKMVLLK